MENVGESVECVGVVVVMLVSLGGGRGHVCWCGPVLTLGGEGPGN